MPDTAAILDECFRQAFSRPEPLTVSQWADRFRQITRGEVKGQWSTARTPYLREVMDAAGDSFTREIVFMKCSQSGGTEALLNALFYWIDRRPGDCMWGWPNFMKAAAANKLRFLPAARETPVIAERLGASREDKTSAVVNFKRMLVFFVGTQSQTNTESEPCRYGIVDEVDRCGEGTVDAVRKRCKTYSDAKLMMPGTPGYAGRGIDAEYQGTDRRRWWTPCPHCGEYQTRDWSYVRWAHKGRYGRSAEAEPERVLATAIILCKHCHKPIDGTSQHDQARAGVWCPHGCSVDRAGRIVGTVPVTSKRGWHLTGLDSTIHRDAPSPYGAVAARWVALMRNPETGQGEWKDWFNHDLGVPYTPKGESLEVSQLRAILGPSGPAPTPTPGTAPGTAQSGPEAGAPFRLGEVPDWARVLTAGVDVQTDRAYAVVRAWGPGGLDSALVWHEAIALPSGRGLEPLDELLIRRPWVTVSGRPIRLAARFIDSGDRTVEVYAYCKARPNCWPVKGRNSPDWAIPWDWTRLEKWPDGTVMKGGLMLLMVNTTVWSDRLMSRLRARLPREGDDGAEPTPGTAPAPKTTPEGDPETAAADLVGGSAPAARLWLPTDTGAEFLQQLTSEHKVLARVGGRPKMVWQLQPGRTDNHYRDAMVYDECGADAGGVARLREAAPNPAPPASAPEPASRSRSTVRRGGLASRARERRG